MASQWQRRPNAPAANGQELWAKDRVMASQNAANLALGLVQLEFEVGKVAGADPGDMTPLERFTELYEQVYNMHLQKGGDVGAAVASVTRAFPGSAVDEPGPVGPGVAAAAPVGGSQYSDDSGPGATVLGDGFKKHAGKTIERVYEEDPTYIRNFIAEKARDEDLKMAARAFLTEVDASS